MSPRQARQERREAERKTRKAELKRAKAAGKEFGFVSQRVRSSALPRRSPEQSDGLHSRLLSQNGPAASPDHSRAAINRQNAQHSTGPRTPDGKLASSRNSLKHGLDSGTLLIPGEDPAAFEALRDAPLEEHRPTNETEALLINEMAQSWWLTQRAIRLQNECFTPEGVDQKQLSLFLRYQTTHDRLFYKALTTLLRVKELRARKQSVISRSPTLTPERSDALPSGFVSQNGPTLLAKDGFVSQNPFRDEQHQAANRRAEAA